MGGDEALPNTKAMASVTTVSETAELEMYLVEDVVRLFACLFDGGHTLSFFDPSQDQLAILFLQRPTNTALSGCLPRGAPACVDDGLCFFFPF